MSTLVDHFGHLFTTAGDFSMGTGCRLMVASCFSWEQPNQYRRYYTGWTLLRLSECDRERAPSYRDCSSKHDVRHKSPAIPEFLPPCSWYSTCHQPARLRLTTCSDRSPSSRGQGISTLPRGLKKTKKKSERGKNESTRKRERSEINRNPEAVGRAKAPLSQ